MPGRDVPAIPPEMVFLPRRAPFSVYDMSSWSRTIFVPLSILYAHKPVVRLPAGRGVAELFPHDRLPRQPERRFPRRASSSGQPWKKLFFGVDRLLKTYERLPGSGRLCAGAIERAGAWMIERLASSDGLSAILPAMANSVMALSVLGYAAKHPLMREQLGTSTVCCSAIARGHAAHAAVPVAGLGHGARDVTRWSRRGSRPSTRALRRAASWLLGKQTHAPGRLGASATRRRPGGWYFEHRNEFYPDVDDTCMALMVLRRARADGRRGAQEAAIAARPGLDAGHAERRRRLGQLRSRQRQAVADRTSRSPTTTR